MQWVFLLVRVLALMVRTRIQAELAWVYFQGVVGVVLETEVPLRWVVLSLDQRMMRLD
jgi:hypothetical protein